MSGKVPENLPGEKLVDFAMARNRLGGSGRRIVEDIALGTVQDKNGTGGFETGDHSESKKSLDDWMS